MFAWMRKRREAKASQFVLDRMAPTFRSLALRLTRSLGAASDEGLPLGLLEDAFFVGFVDNAACLFVKIASGGKASYELIGLASYSSFRLAFPFQTLSVEKLDEIQQRTRSTPEYLAGASAADLIVGVCFLPKARTKDWPEVVAAKAALAKMPEGFREMVGGGSEEDLLIFELLEEHFYAVVSGLFDGSQRQSQC